MISAGKNIFASTVPTGTLFTGWDGVFTGVGGVAPATVGRDPVPFAAAARDQSMFSLIQTCSVPQLVPANVVSLFGQSGAAFKVDTSSPEGEQQFLERWGVLKSEVARTFREDPSQVEHHFFNEMKRRGLPYRDWLPYRNFLAEGVLCEKEKIVHRIRIMESRLYSAKINGDAEEAKFWEEKILMELHYFEFSVNILLRRDLRPRGVFLKRVEIISAGLVELERAVRAYREHFLAAVRAKLIWQRERPDRGSAFDEAYAEVEKLWALRDDYSLMGYSEFGELADMDIPDEVIRRAVEGVLRKDVPHDESATVLAEIIVSVFDEAMAETPFGWQKEDKLADVDGRVFPVTKKVFGALIDQLRADGVSGRVRALEIGYGDIHNNIDALLELGVEVWASEVDPHRGKYRENLEKGREVAIASGELHPVGQDVRGLSPHIIVLNLPEAFRHKQFDGIFSAVEENAEPGTYLLLTTDTPDVYIRHFDEDSRWGKVIERGGRVMPTAYAQVNEDGAYGGSYTTVVFKRLP